jgi:multiple antibiotic resistance protein
MELSELLATFLLAFPALFSIVNPVAGAFVFNEATAGRDDAGMARLAGLVARNSLLVLMVTMWTGAVVLGFFGISLAALRIAGGLVLSTFAWRLLTAPDARTDQKRDEAAPALDHRAPEDDSALAFFPLTIPFTTGPGTIAVAVTLGSGHPRSGFSTGYVLGLSLAALATAATIWAFYRYARRIAALLGPSGTRVISRLAAFVLLCIGVQILILGVSEVLTGVLRPLLART